jgi:hypothetical protein
MKKIILLLLFTSGLAFGQINLTGDAKYFLNIVGYQDRDSNGCGDIDGLRNITATKQDGTAITVYSDRKIYEKVDHILEYTKDNPITNIEFKKVLRWSGNGITCDSGPDDTYNSVAITDGCFSSFLVDAGGYLKYLTVTSKPYIKFNIDNRLLYLSETDILTVTLPDNVSAVHYNWKYRVGNGPEMSIPNSFNFKSTLNVKGSDFLLPEDYGKTVEVWTRMNCSSGLALAIGIAKRDAFVEAQATFKDCTKKCNPFGFGGSLGYLQCLDNCGKAFETNYNKLVSQKLTQELIDSYQSVTSVSESIKFTHLKSAPKIQSSEKTPVKCFAGKDGSVKLFFDRQLLGCNNCKTTAVIPDETLNFTLFLNGTNVTPDPNNVIIQLDSDNKRFFTIPNLSPGNYELKLNGFYNNNVTYSSTIANPYKFTIGQPSPVQFTATATPVNCSGGSDGTLTIKARGGSVEEAPIPNVFEPFYEYSLDNGSTWTQFLGTSKKEVVIKDLLPNNYTVKVRDSRGCVAKVPTATSPIGIVTNVSEVDKTVAVATIQTQPGVSVTYSDGIKPLYAGDTRGGIVANVTGGNPFLNTVTNKIYYNYKWKDSSGNELPASKITTSVSTDGKYILELKAISPGKYYLTIEDKNFATATANQTPTVNQNAGCTNANTEYELVDPKPIIVNLSVKQTISCYEKNEFGNETDANFDNRRDESQDGIIEAQVTGGVPFTGNQNFGMPYIFSWKKKDAAGVWQPFVGEAATIQNLSEGDYALNVKDANGIALGTFDANGVFTKIDKETPLTQPDKLEVTIAKTDVNCLVPNSGQAIATPTGGTPPYTYVWTDANESETATADNLIARSYLVTVTDSKKCTVQGSVTINQPKGVVITATTQKSPSCTDGVNGAKGEIVLKIVNQENQTDISGLCTYSWNTTPVQTTKDIKDLLAGSYTVTVTDQTQCTYTETFTLQNPPLLKVDLGPDRTLCNAQEHELDITIADPNAKYVWTSTTGFVSSKPKVKLNQAGVYYAKATSSLGCFAEDRITITTSNATIASEFLLTSQAYVGDEIIIVNSSSPFGENTEWVIPDGVEVVEQKEKYMVIKCNTVGTYAIALKETQGDCYALYAKNINVEAKTATTEANTGSNQFIKEFSVTPNPTTGRFEAIIKLNEISAVYLRLYSETGQKTNTIKSEKGSKNYVIDFDINNLANQTYILILETAKQTLVKKIIKI